MGIFDKLKNKKAKAQTEIENRPLQREAATTPRQPAALLKQAWLTEKAGHLSAYRKYIFLVSREANKSEIKKVIEKNYGVKVSAVNIINEKGKLKRLGRSIGRTSAFKKAIVSLKEGEKIELI